MEQSSLHKPIVTRRPMGSWQPWVHLRLGGMAVAQTAYNTTAVGQTSQTSWNTTSSRHARRCTRGSTCELFRPKKERKACLQSDHGTFSQTNNCASIVNPGAGCTISISFKPT